MRTLIFLLTSFSSFAQVDTIQPPCDLTRQQTRLWHDLRETQLKLYDKQHARENTKEIKALKWGLRSERIENRRIKDIYDFKTDSLTKSYKLDLREEKNRSKEAVDKIKIERDRERNNAKIANKELSIEKAKARKSANWNIVWICVAVLGTGAMFLLYRFKK